MAIGIDFGTSYLVTARKSEDDKIKIANERNCFLDVNSEFEDMLSASNYKYIKDTENGEQKLFIVGKDALRLANLYSHKGADGSKKTDLRRPMQKMVINSRSDKKAVQMLKYMIQSLVGKPEYRDEVAVVSIPANPLSGEFNNTFHSGMCEMFIKELGYVVYPINEALSVVYATNPVTTDEDGNELPMTGIGISWGAGGTNACLAYKGKDTITFAIDRGGDWIDAQTSSFCNLSSSEVMIMKEKASKDGIFDLSSPVQPDEILQGLYIYYKNLIEIVVRQFREEFLSKGTNFPDPIEVVVSGGTSKPSGFEELVATTIKNIGWPFDIKGVRKATDPLAATARGCLMAAISREKKSEKA